jgi:pilus assembly protein CpaC
VALLVFLGLATGAEAPQAQPTGMGNVGTVEAPSYINLVQGKSLTLLVDGNVNKLDIGDKEIAHALLLGKRQGKREVYLLGKKIGSTNLILWNKSGQSTVVDVIVGMDVAGLQSKLQLLFPTEKDIKVTSAADSLVLTGTVADTVKVDKAVALAEIYSGKKVVNFLSAGAPQQVMLEVKVAEVSKTLSDKLGSSFTFGGAAINGWTYSLLANFLTASPGSVTLTSPDGQKSLTLDAAKTDGLVKILAEPTIMAMSGQEGSFLAGGTIFIPVPQTGVGGTTITLEQKDFGVALRFTPTVLEDGRINLKVAPEVSELGRNVTVGTQVLPSITTRRAATTVQLNDGQSFAIGGLIKNNVTATVTAFPGLGELPVIGALFRSSDFLHDRSELLFVITPRLVKPLPPDYVLPTDNYIQPSRSEYLLGGKLEGAPKAEPQPEAAPAEPVEPAPASGGFQMQ